MKVKRLEHNRLHSEYQRCDRGKYWKMLRISLYSVWMWENTDQNNSEYGHLLPSVILLAVISLLNVNNKNTSEICSKLNKQTDVFIDNFEHISHLALMFLLLTLNM